MDEFGTELGTAHGAKPAQLLLLARLLLGANVIDAIAVIAVGMFAVACDLAVVIAVLPDFLWLLQAPEMLASRLPACRSTCRISFG